MKNCICDLCANLKPSIDEETGKVEFYECEFDFPSENCEGCELEGCDCTCENFTNRHEEEVFIVKCESCGKELKQHGKGQEEGKIFCMECFLKNM